jgi:hypothetical protein
MKTIKSLEIKSADQALKISKELGSLGYYRTRETQLSQRILIYNAKLLEKILAAQQTKKRIKKLSRWQIHVKKVLKAGGTMQQATEQYNR